MDNVPTIEELLSHCGVKKSDLECRCPGELKIEIAKKLSDWKVFGRTLGIAQERIEAIDRENHTEDQRKIALLDTWDQKFGSDATCLKLVTALHSCRRRDLIEDVVCKAVTTLATPIPSPKEETDGHKMDDVGTYYCM